MLSVLILTRNEEVDLPGALQSLAWCDDVVVYDSYSTDRTQSIALEFGARFIQRPSQDISISFGGDEGHHRTWGLKHIDFLHPWLLVLDADERLNNEAFYEIKQVLTRQSIRVTQLPPIEPVAYQLRRRDFFQGRHLKYVQATPWYIRLFRPEYVQYERLINPATIVTGHIGSLNCFIDHYPFSKGLSHWISRHNTYSTLEAKQSSSASAEFKLAHLRGALCSPYFHERRQMQKHIFMYLPARPLLKFVWLYIMKRGFLDGGPGFTYALLQSIYEYFIILKVRELR